MRLRFAIGYCIPAAVAVFVATLPAIRSSELSFAPPFGLALWFCSGLLVTFFAPMAWSNKISHGEYVRIGIRSILRLGPVCLGTLVVGFARNAPAEMALLFAVVSAVLIDLARSFAPARRATIWRQRKVAAILILATACAIYAVALAYAAVVMMCMSAVACGWRAWILIRSSEACFDQRVARPLCSS